MMSFHFCLTIHDTGNKNHKMSYTDLHKILRLAMKCKLVENLSKTCLECYSNETAKIQLLFAELPSDMLFEKHCINLKR